MDPVNSQQNLQAELNQAMLDVMARLARLKEDPNSPALGYSAQQTFLRGDIELQVLITNRDILDRQVQARLSKFIARDRPRNYSSFFFSFPINFDQFFPPQEPKTRI